MAAMAYEIYDGYIWGPTCCMVEWIFLVILEQRQYQWTIQEALILNIGDIHGGYFFYSRMELAVDDGSFKWSTQKVRNAAEHGL